MNARSFDSEDLERANAFLVIVAQLAQCAAESGEGLNVTHCAALGWLACEARDQLGRVRSDLPSRAGEAV
jgi:hypothetical protein